jgi:hypothetical protein
MAISLTLSTPSNDDASTLELQCPFQIEGSDSEPCPQCPPLQCTVAFGYEQVFSIGSHLLLGPCILQSRNRAQFTTGAPGKQRRIEVANHVPLPSWLLRGLPLGDKFRPRDVHHDTSFVYECIKTSKLACESAHKATSVGGEFRGTAETQTAKLRSLVSSRVTTEGWRPSPDHPCLYISFAGFTAQGKHCAPCLPFGSDGAVAFPWMRATHFLDPLPGP